MQPSGANIYFETSAVNYLAHRYSVNDAIATRGRQLAKGDKWYLSPVTLWEILLTRDASQREYLLFISQHFFYEHLLKTPSEIIVDYINNNCPKIQHYTDFHSTTELAAIWTCMCKEPRATIAFDFYALKEWTHQIKQNSKKVNKIINGITLKEKLETEEQKLWVLFESIYNRQPYKSDVKTIVQLQKLALVFLFYYACIVIDLTPEIIDTFWTARNISEPIERLDFLLTNYPCLLQQGPFMEFPIMAQNQIKLNPKTGRGLFHDSLHCIYLPFVDLFFTNDNHFTTLRKLKVFPYHKKIISISADVKWTGTVTEIIK